MAWSDKLHGSWEMATYQQTGTLNTNSSPGRFAEVVVLLLHISLEVGSVCPKVPPLPVLPGRVPSPPSPAQARLAAEGGVRKSTRSSRLVSPTSTSRLPPHLVSRSVFYGDKVWSANQYLAAIPCSLTSWRVRWRAPAGERSRRGRRGGWGQSAPPGAASWALPAAAARFPTGR